MRVLLLGATGKIGSLTLDRALAAGHEVVVLARDPSRLRAVSNLTTVTGDVGDVRAVRAAMSGVQVVIAALGPRSNTVEEELALETGMRTVVETMGESGVRRIVTLSGAAVDAPGDRKPMFDRLASRIVRRMARHVVGAKQREYDVLAAADLDWTALRPPLVADGPPRGYRLATRLQPGARVRRADVARALIDQLGDERFIRAAPFVLPPD